MFYAAFWVGVINVNEAKLDFSESLLDDDSTNSDSKDENKIESINQHDSSLSIILNDEIGYGTLCVLSLN